MFQMKRLYQLFNDEKIRATLKKLGKNRHFTYGVPFVLFVVGAPLVLKDLMSWRYEYRNQRLWTPEEEAKLQAARVQLKPPEERTVEAIYEEHMKKEGSKLDDYQMIRGPRPWEQPSEEFMKQREELEKRNKVKNIKNPRELGLHY